MELYERVNVKPVVVQNRFYASSKYDIGLRKFCRERGIIYESFWTLTANPALLKAKETRQLASQLIISPAAALYCLVLGLGNTTILNGTTNPQNMRDDWKAIQLVREYAKVNPGDWSVLMTNFKKVIGDTSI